MKKKVKCLYTCDGDDCEASINQAPLICYDAILCWKATVREGDGKTRNRRGCITEQDQVPLYCYTKAIPILTECCREDLCNDGPFPVLPDPSSDGSEMWNTTTKVTLAVLVPLLGLLVCGIFLYCRKQRSRENRMTTHIESGMGPRKPARSSPTSVPGGATRNSYGLRAIAAGYNTLKQYFKGKSLTSGSGAGRHLVVQDTLAKYVTLTTCLSTGNGNFGREVWRGIWHGENVAVKIYFSRDEALWTRETEVYSQMLPSRHDNILSYVGSDITSRASCTQLWLVTQYHPLGSLYNYLVQLPQPLNHHQMFNICLSIANGLLYLHTEIEGTQGKPAITHRNLNTTNILVKNNGACVIADLAHAVIEDRLASDKFDMKTVTKRYMSPELLEQTLNQQCLEDFRRADIYSLGLVFWEVCRSCISNGVALDYAAPYSEWLVSGNQEPTMEEMRKLVVADKRRPTIPNHWHSDSTLARMATMMKECWYAKAASRLTILRVKKTLVKLASNNPNVDLSLD